MAGAISYLTTGNGRTISPGIRSNRIAGRTDSDHFLSLEKGPEVAQRLLNYLLAPKPVIVQLQ
jgi:hypothetical protein